MAATIFKLHSENFRSFPFTSAASYDAGELEKIEDTVGVVLGPNGGDSESGDLSTLIYKADKITVVKSTTTGQNAWLAGAKLYLDEGEKAVCDEASGNILCGIALEENVAADTEALIELDGILEIVA